MNSEIFIRVLGQLSIASYPSFREIVSFDETDPSNFILFCDYSNFDIPVGTIFDKIETNKGIIVYSESFYLKGVTQQYFKKWNEVPKGWKTICNFQFNETKIPLEVKSLPYVTKWEILDENLTFRV